MKEVKTSRRNLTRTHALRLVALLAALYLPTVPAFGQDPFLQLADTPDPVTPGQVDEWIAEAEKGDWQLMTEFAATYFFKDECHKLKYGHRCRAMAARPEVGKKFVLEIIDTPVVPVERPVLKGTKLYYQPYIRGFQEAYARERWHDAWAEQTEKNPDPNSSACKDYIKYMSLAAENGQICAPRSISGAYEGGLCVEKDTVKSAYYRKLDIHCPQY